MSRIRLAENFRAVFYAPFYATLALGHFKAEGLDVELVNSAGPGAQTSELLGGGIDVAWGGPMRIMKSRNEPGAIALTCFCDVVRRDPFYLVARPGAGAFQLSDLPRLKLGSVSEVPTPWMCLQQDLRDIGIDPASISRVADRAMADNLAALGRGEIDLVQLFEPFAAQAERTGTGRIVHAQSGRGDTAYTTFIATPEGIGKNRAAFAAMTRAVGRTQAWMAGHDGGDLAGAVQSFYPDVLLEDLVTAFDRYKKAQLWATDTTVSRAGYERLGESLKSGGFIARIPAYEDCVENLA